ncbi:MAG: hypothetical protein U9O94_11835, partial [Nanoarchaeota archaeon]|nr:hypothetical protein [Nanoarchaeota archaeon]
MVKKFIKGILGKNEDKPASEESKSDNDVPDELPALAEDTMEEEKKEEKPEEKPVSEEKKEAPAELPAIDEKKPEEKAEKKEEPKEDNDDLLNEFKKYKEDFKGDGEKKEVSAPKEVEKSVDAPHEEPIKEPKEGISNNIHELAEGTNKLEDETGFFSELLSVVKNQGINDSILNQDLLKRMKDHWYFHPKEKIKSENKDKLSGELLNKLSELKRAEERWIAQKRFIEDDKRILTEKERDIETKTEELHKILNQLRFYEPASEEAAFWFDNGMVAKNLHELMNL